MALLTLSANLLLCYHPITYGHKHVHPPCFQLVSVRLVPVNRFRARYAFHLWGPLVFPIYSLSLHPGPDPLYGIAISHAIFTNIDLKIGHDIRIAIAKGIISAHFDIS